MLVRWAQKVKTLFTKSSDIAYQFKGMKHRAPCKEIFCPCIHPQRPDGVKRSKYFVSESSHVVYQTKANVA